MQSTSPLARRCKRNGPRAVVELSIKTFGSHSLQTYFSSLLAPVFETVGWENDDDTEYDAYQRSVVRGVITQLACDFGLPECRRKALKAYVASQDSGE